MKVTDTKLAETLGLSSGKFYCYYKPSFIINGFEEGSFQDVNVEMMQALDKVCRDEITVNAEKINPVFDDSDKLVTENLANRLFD